ncbi:MAG: type II toxin-antitoxin system RelE/ParE family toxin, partial [bacterium]
MYEVYLEQSVERDLEKLPAEEFHRIIRRIKPLRQNPRPAGCPKIKGSKHDWRIRVGDHRIVYEIVERRKTVRVVMVRHRLRVDTFQIGNTAAVQKSRRLLLKQHHLSGSFHELRLLSRGVALNPKVRAIPRPVLPGTLN